LVQITLISSWCLYVVPNTQLAYGIWIMLLVITKQWPGFPGVFKGVLNSLQQYNRKAMIDFIQLYGFIISEIGYSKATAKINDIEGFTCFCK